MSGQCYSIPVDRPQKRRPSNARSAREVTRCMFITRTALGRFWMSQVNDRFRWLLFDDGRFLLCIDGVQVANVAFSPETHIGTVRISLLYGGLVRILHLNGPILH